MPLQDLITMSVRMLMVSEPVGLVIPLAIVACVAITAIVAFVILGWKAIDAARPKDVPTTVETLTKGVAIFTRFPPTRFLRSLARRVFPGEQGAQESSCSDEQETL